MMAPASGQTGMQRGPPITSEQSLQTLELIWYTGSAFSIAFTGQTGRQASQAVQRSVMLNDMVFSPSV
jgi:hypothetical protein